MQSSFDFFAREHDDVGIAVYDSRMNYLDSNLAFNSFFHCCVNCSLSDLFAQMVSGEDSLSQMIMVVEVERGVGSCSVAYSSDGDRREFRVKLIARGEGNDREYICSFSDVTELLFIQKVLMHRSDSLERLDRNSPVGVFKSAVGGNVLYVNNGIVSMLGYENEHQLYNIELSATWADVSDREELIEILTRDKIANGYETRWRRKDGSVFWVSLTATGQLDRNGNLVYIEVVALDIDQKKRAEDDLKSLQNSLGNLIESKTAELKRANNLLLREVAERQKAESIYAVLHSIAEETVKTDSLKGLLEFIHQKLSSIIHTPNLFFAFYDSLSATYSFPYSVDVHNGFETFIGLESMAGSLTEYVRQTGQPLLIDHDTYDKMLADGRIKAVGNPSEQWMGVPLRGSEGIWGILVVQSYTMKNVFTNADLILLSGLAESVSMAVSRYRAEQNRRKIEALYNTVVDNLHQGVLMCDPLDRILFANEAFSRIVGIPAEELKGMEITDFIPPRDTGRTVGAREKRSLGECSSYHLTLIRPDGEKIPVAVSGIPRFEEGDIFVGTIGLFDVIQEGELLLD